jgi:hypothetical protein
MNSSTYHLLEAIPKLVQAVASHQAVSSVLGLKLEVVQQVLAKDPSHVAKLIESIREEEYRCVLSNRPMTSPVMAPDGSYYEQSRLEAHPTLSNEDVIPIRRFTELLSQFALNTGAIDLIEQVLERLNSTQLGQIEQA